ncbi:unnamed protein product [Camellia sinensis]
MSSLTACILHKLIAQSSLSGDPPESMGTMVISTEIWYSSLPESYVRPESDRPKLSEVEDCQNVPIIDLGCEDRSLIVHQTGQVINHGVSMEAVEKMQQVANEFFNLSVEEKMKLYSDDPSKTMRLSTSFNLKKEMVHNWRDYLRLHCNSLDQYVPEWPSNPPSFKCIGEWRSLCLERNYHLHMLEPAWRYLGGLHLIYPCTRCRRGFKKRVRKFENPRRSLKNNFEFSRMYVRGLDFSMVSTQEHKSKGDDGDKRLGEEEGKMARE